MTTSSFDIWAFLSNQGIAFLLMGIGIYALAKPLVVSYKLYEEVRAERDRALKLLDKSTEVMQTTLEKLGDLLSVLKPTDPATPPARHRSTKEGP